MGAERFRDLRKRCTIRGAAEAPTAADESPRRRTRTSVDPAARHGVGQKAARAELNRAPVFDQRQAILAVGRHGDGLRHPGQAPPFAVARVALHGYEPVLRA
jgi:hypothetical protein